MTDRCPRCNEFRWNFERHKCPPAFEVRQEWHESGDEELVYAHDAQAAAEKYAEDYECRDVEWDCGSGAEPMLVLVRTAEAPDGDWQKFTVTGEMVPTYHAHEGWNDD